MSDTLAWKIALLITSPSILNFFQPESNEELEIKIPQVPHFSIERIEKELKISAKGGFTCIHKEGTNQVTRTLDIDPFKQQMWSELKLQTL